MRKRIVTVAAVALSLNNAGAPAQGHASPKNYIQVQFTSAPEISMPNPTDSNSPSIWIGDVFCVFNSSAGSPRRACGASIADAKDLPDSDGRSFRYVDDKTQHGRWLESIVREDESGWLFGFYHNEIPINCNGAPDFRPSPVNGEKENGIRLYPQIGEAISTDNGFTWEDLGIILSPRPGTYGHCNTDHPITNGGIGDFSVIADHKEHPAEHYLYFFFSSYGGELEEQGVSLARILWIDLRAPVDFSTGKSRVEKWFRGTWYPLSGLGGASTALFADNRKVDWNRMDNNGYWGPSVHWNVDLQKYVILMSRSKGGNYSSDGIFVTATKDISNPLSWALPKKIVEGQGTMWYPQVIGDASIHGTDKLAGRQARYFNAGSSRSLMTFVDFENTSAIPVHNRPRPRQ